jgi:hypothetical protein
VPNLVGIHDPTAERRSLEADLARMMLRVDIPAYGYLRRRAFGRNLACGNVAPRAERGRSDPALDESRGVWILLDGELLNGPELSADLARRGVFAPPPEDGAAIALGCYLLDGFDVLRRLNGTFNLVIHHLNPGTTYLVSDRFGSRPLYYAEDGARFVFASEAKAVIAGRSAPTSAGGAGLLELLASRGQLGDATWLDGIRVLDPGTAVRLKGTDIRKKRWFRLRFAESNAAGIDDHAEALSSRLGAAVRRCLRRRDGAPTALSLTGGAASCSLALAVAASGSDEPGTCFAIAHDPHAPEGRLAEDLAWAVGLRPRTLVAELPVLLADADRVLTRLIGRSPFGPRRFFSAQIDRLSWRGEAMSALSSGSSMLWHPLVAGRLGVLLDAPPSRILTGGIGPVGLGQRIKRERHFESIQRRFLFQDRSLLELVLTPAFVARHEACLRDAPRRWLAGVDGDEPLAIESAFEIEHVERRRSLASYLFATRAPCLDVELAETAARIPPRLQARAYQRMFARQLARVVGAGAAAASLARFTARVLGPLAFRAEARALREDGELSRSILRWVESKAFPGDVFNRRGIKTLLDRFAAGASGGMATLFGHLCQIARWHAWGLLDGSARGIPPEADPSSFGGQVSYGSFV